MKGKKRSQKRRKTLNNRLRKQMKMKNQSSQQMVELLKREKEGSLNRIKKHPRASNYSPLLTDHHVDLQPKDLQLEVN